jgi:DNA-binding MarR family transcriptional regulator
MEERLPLATLLSQVLVAFTIEFDNEAEHRIPHRTTRHGPTTRALPAPWMVSLAMWENCMRHLPEDGIPLAELEHRSRTPTNLNGMVRWRYVTVTPDPADPRPKVPRSAWIVRPTLGGRIAQGVWRPLAAEIETRWQDRFGAAHIEELRLSLAELDRQLDPALLDCLPILKYGLFSMPAKAPAEKSCALAIRGDSRPLYALLSRALLTFAIDFEQGHKLSLAIYANLMRVLDDKIVRVRDLPELSGVSKESISMGMGILKKAELAVVEKSNKGEPWLSAYLTPRGRKMRKACSERMEAVEVAWNARYGADLLARLRAALLALGAGSTLDRSRLAQCLEPYPDGWRAALPRPVVLPHFPMVLHRGGFPDGS